MPTATRCSARVNNAAVMIVVGINQSQLKVSSSFGLWAWRQRAVTGYEALTDRRVPVTIVRVLLVAVVATIDGRLLAVTAWALDCPLPRVSSVTGVRLHVLVLDLARDPTKCQL